MGIETIANAVIPNPITIGEMACGARWGLNDFVFYFAEYHSGRLNVRDSKRTRTHAMRNECVEERNAPLVADIVSHGVPPCIGERGARLSLGQSGVSN
jgi:hypothetical protein